MGIHVFTDRTLRERDKVKDTLITALDQQVARLTGQNMVLAEEHARLNAEMDERYDGLERQLQDAQIAFDAAIEEKHAMQVREAELVAALTEQSRELHVLMQGKVRYEPMPDLLAFLRRCASGSNIRSDKPGGKSLMIAARDLLARYEEQAEVTVREPMDLL